MSTTVKSLPAFWAKSSTPTLLLLQKQEWCCSTHVLSGALMQQTTDLVTAWGECQFQCIMWYLPYVHLHNVVHPKKGSDNYLAARALQRCCKTVLCRSTPCAVRQSLC